MNCRTSSKTRHASGPGLVARAYPVWLAESYGHSEWNTRIRVKASDLSQAMGITNSRDYAMIIGDELMRLSDVKINLIHQDHLHFSGED